MSERSDGGPAFPQDGKAWPIGKDAQGFDMYAYSSSGMSLRDYFAAAALQGIIGLASQQNTRFVPEDIPFVVQRAYMAADAMLAERCK